MLHASLDSEKARIGQFYLFAEWCLNTKGKGEFLSDVGTAVACAFYEHLPADPLVRSRMPIFISGELQSRLRGIFAYHLSEAELIRLEEELNRARADSLPENNSAHRKTRR
jgi:hypothetical protein